MAEDFRKSVNDKLMHLLKYSESFQNIRQGFHQKGIDNQTYLSILFAELLYWAIFIG